VSAPSAYQRRIIDEVLDELIAGLPAIAIEGPKGVGKTRTAAERARTVRALDNPTDFAIAGADPARILVGERPILIDEWQRLPVVWDLVRRAVDDGAPAGSFLLTGSAVPNPPPTHSGAGRIVSLRMRPLSLAERGIGEPTVSLRSLLSGERAQVSGRTQLTVSDYADEIVASGLPGIRGLGERVRRAQLDGYLARIVDRDIPDDAGLTIRNPAALRRWMTAYAAATATSTSFEKIRDAASAGQDDKPSKQTAQSYRDALAKIWVLDDLDAWIPMNNALNQLRQAPKHQLADPALAARLLRIERAGLLAGEATDPPVPRDGPLLGALFESLAAQSLRAYAEPAEAKIWHLRTAAGRQEIDLIVERDDRRVVAIEVKLKRAADDRDGRHLNWLEGKLGRDRVLDKVLVTTGPEAYRRKDGVAVVPLALLGP
jgi:predicted AAA+ superfamily ATPase